MFIQIKSFVLAIIAVSLLVTACSRNGESETVAGQFVRLYFVENNLPAAVKLSSGAAREKIEGLLREMQAVEGKKAAIEKPSVKVKLMESLTDAQDEMQYVYQVTPDIEVEGMEPVTARVWLSKEGGTWYVSKFVQEE